MQKNSSNENESRVSGERETEKKFFLWHWRISVWITFASWTQNFRFFLVQNFFFNRSYQRIIDHRPIQIFLTWMEIGNDFLLLQSWKLFTAEPNSCRTKNKWGADWSQAFKIFTVHVLPRSWLSEAKLGSLHYLSELQSCNLILGAASFDPSDFCAREPNGISSTSRQGLNKLKWAWTLDSIWPITNPNLRSPRFESRQIQWRSKLSNYQL